MEQEPVRSGAFLNHQSPLDHLDSITLLPILPPSAVSTPTEDHRDLNHLYRRGDLVVGTQQKDDVRSRSREVRFQHRMPPGSTSVSPSWARRRSHKLIHASQTTCSRGFTFADSGQEPVPLAQVSQTTDASGRAVQPSSDIRRVLRRLRYAPTPALLPPRPPVKASALRTNTSQCPSVNHAVTPALPRLLKLVPRVTDQAR